MPLVTIMQEHKLFEWSEGFPTHYVLLLLIKMVHWEKRTTWCGSLSVEGAPGMLTLAYPPAPGGQSLLIL